MNKQELRVFVRRALSEMTDSDRQRESSAIVSAIESRPDFVQAGTVLCYMPLACEPDILPLMHRWCGLKRLVVPRVIGDGLMELREFDPSGLLPGAFGILEPSDSCPLISPAEIELALVPGVAFDHSGARLGHGKGFYDRLLPQLRCPCIGLAFSCQIVDSVPTNPWDKPMDGMYYCNLV